MGMAFSVCSTSIGKNNINFVLHEKYYIIVKTINCDQNISTQKKSTNICICWILNMVWLKDTILLLLCGELRIWGLTR